MPSPTLAVTTRSRLRSVRFFPSMFVASLRVRRQLARTPGCLRWASVIAGPREFWTITVWASRDEMLEFMRSDAHEDIMWRFGKWLDSFWLTRWRPTTDERGAWKDLAMAPPARPETRRSQSPEAQAALEAALDAMPNLKASVGPDGAPCYENSPFARRQRRAVTGGAGLVLRIEAPHRRQAVAARADSRTLAARLRAAPDVLRVVRGVGRAREWYVMAIMRDEAACSAFLDDEVHERLAARWGQGYWAMRWEPANEFGHWDGLRLRKERLGSQVRLPETASHLR